MGDITLILTDGTEVPAIQQKDSKVEVLVSEHNENYAWVHIKAGQIVDDCVINEYEYWPLGSELSRLTKIRQVNHYPSRVER